MKNTSDNTSRKYLLLAVVMFTMAIGMSVGLWLSVKGTVLASADTTVSVPTVLASEKSVTDLALAEFGLSSESVVPMSASVRLKKSKSSVR
ncbi:MAG: hypothetical protein WCP09_01500 [Candidatus Taylorbacteria bacterium]